MVRAPKRQYRFSVTHPCRPVPLQIHNPVRGHRPVRGAFLTSRSNGSRPHRTGPRRRGGDPPPVRSRSKRDRRPCHRTAGSKSSARSRRRQRGPSRSGGGRGPAGRSCSRPSICLQTCFRTSICVRPSICSRACPMGSIASSRAWLRCGTRCRARGDRTSTNPR